MSETRNCATGERGELEAATASDVTGLVDVQEGGIVSRTLAKRPGGTVTLFGFDAGQALSEHSAPFDALVQVLVGRLRLRVGGRDVDAGAGQLVLMPANVPHALEALDPTVMLLTMLRGQEG